MNQLRDLVWKERAITFLILLIVLLYNELVQAEERKPGQVCILSVKIVAYVMLALQEAVAEGH